MSGDSPAYRQRIGYHTALLGGVALPASALLVIGDVSTRGAIAARRTDDLLASLGEVVPAALHDNSLLEDTLELRAQRKGLPLTVYRARRGGEVSALAYGVRGERYGGTIEMLMGVDRDGRVLGVRVLAHKETPGLGDRIEIARSDWIRGFEGLGPADAASPDFAVSKDGGRFDQFTGATITPRAVVAAGRQGLRTFGRHRADLLAPPAGDVPAPTADEEAMSTPYRQILRDGLWDNNVVTGQMLALCPVVAVTGSATNGLGMGLATLAVMLVTGLAVSVIREHVTQEVRITLFVLLIAAGATLVDMALNAWLHELHKVLGLFIPLIVTNCAILGRAESFASRNAVPAAPLDGLAMGLGSCLVLVVLGALREIVGSGTLFADASLLLGEAFHAIELTLLPDHRGFLLMVLPAGGFLGLGFLLAGTRLLESARSPREPSPGAIPHPSGA